MSQKVWIWGGNLSKRTFHASRANEIWRTVGFNSHFVPQHREISEIMVQIFTFHCRTSIDFYVYGTRNIKSYFQVLNLQNILTRNEDFFFNRDCVGIYAHQLSDVEYEKETKTRWFLQRIAKALVQEKVFIHKKKNFPCVFLSIKKPVSSYCCPKFLKRKNLQRQKNRFLKFIIVKGKIILLAKKYGKSFWIQHSTRSNSNESYSSSRTFIE